MSRGRWEGWDRRCGFWVLRKRESDMEGDEERERERERERLIVGFGVVRERMVGRERWRVAGLTSLLSN